MHPGRAGRWRPILIGPILALVVIGPLVVMSAATTIGDWLATRHLDRSGLPTTGTVLHYDASLLDATVSYVHPHTDSRLPPEPMSGTPNSPPPTGPGSRLLVDATKPQSVKFAADHFPLLPTVTLLSLVPAAVPAALLALRFAHALPSRAAGPRSTAPPTGCSVGSPARPRSRSGRLQLALYSLDHPRGVGQPLAVVPLVERWQPSMPSTPFALDQLIPLDAKGQIRPLGLIVAQSNGWVAWPEASAFRPGGHGLGGRIRWGWFAPKLQGATAA